jgi:drug/metabolite transporter (DMT)-like permease
MKTSNAEARATVGRRAVYTDTILWACFPILTASTVGLVPPLSALVLSGCVIAIVLTCYTLMTHHDKELLRISAWKYAALSSVCIDVVYYSCIFIGLTYTTPGNAAMIGLCEILTSYIFFNIIQKERISYYHRIGISLMLAGAVLILSQGIDGINYGDILIACAICIAPLGNYFQKRAATHAHPTTVILMRSLIALPILACIAFFFESEPLTISIMTGVFICINGIVIATSRVLWLISITDLPPVEASALSCIGTALTLFLVWALYGTHPSTLQFMALPFLCAGVMLLTHHQTRARHR